MSYTRQERVSLHKKQERVIVEQGEPLLDELREGVFVLRRTSEGLVQYVRYNSVIYKNVLSKV